MICAANITASRGVKMHQRAPQHIDNKVISPIRFSKPPATRLKRNNHGITLNLVSDIVVQLAECHRHLARIRLCIAT